LVCDYRYGNRGCARLARIRCRRCPNGECGFGFGSGDGQGAARKRSIPMVGGIDAPGYGLGGAVGSLNGCGKSLGCAFRNTGGCGVYGYAGYDGVIVA
jgi:hypothetical protein